MCKEIWRDIEGYEGLYRVSSLGNVSSIKKKKVSVLNKSTGYLQVDLYKNNKRKKHSVHRLVALHFLKTIEGKNIVNHLNSLKTDNRLENLEWCNKSENFLHYWGKSSKIGYWSGKMSFDNPNSKKVLGFCFKTNKLLFVFGSASEAARNGFSQGLVSAVARGERSHHKNIIWKYE